MAEKSPKEADYFETFNSPAQLGKWDGFTQFLWNSERGEFFGRTKKSWMRVMGFYFIFYTVLAAFFAVMLIIFYQTLDNFRPKWTLDDSLIGRNPGLGFRPMPKEESVESTLIWFQQGEPKNWNYWTNEINSFLDPYDEGKQYGETFYQCGHGNPPPRDKVCNFDIKTLGHNCTRERNFGYDQGHPCVIIKMNRVWGWEPIPYTPSDDLRHLPSEVQEMVLRFSSTPSVWLTCNGENPGDEENIGPLRYFPGPGFPIYYFPFTNTPGYLSPIVAVMFEKIYPGVLVNVECKAWAKNIVHSRRERRGSIHFEILMD